MKVDEAIDELARFIPRDRIIEVHGGGLIIWNDDAAFLITKNEIADGIFLDIARERWTKLKEKS